MAEQIPLSARVLGCYDARNWHHVSKALQLVLSTSQNDLPQNPDASRLKHQ